ncbi:hypothetical protein PI125_g13977 [Phytophthora idaei]|nr:hypothetical protein PI125_g13977 [Phytophthora idaei]
MRQHELPRLAIRCKELSVVVESEDVKSSGLPSIWSSVKKVATAFTKSSTQRRVLNHVNAV